MLTQIKTQGASHFSKKWLAPFNEVCEVRRQDYGNFNFTESSIQMSLFSNLTFIAW